MKVGKLVSWNQVGYGLVAVTLQERYFLHVSAIDAIPEGTVTPVIGSSVEFEVAPPYKNGKLSRAIRARVVPPVVEMEGGAK